MQYKNLPLLKRRPILDMRTCVQWLQGIIAENEVVGIRYFYSLTSPSQSLGGVGADECHGAKRDGW